MVEFNTLFDYIGRKSAVKLSEDERGLLLDKLKTKSLRRRQYFLHEGEICKSIGFVVKGATRMFATDEKGAEHIIQLSIEDWWVGDYESFYLSTPSKYFVDAVEDVDLILITNDQLRDFSRQVPAIAEMLESLNREVNIANNKRMHAAIRFTADERYEELARTHPQFVQRFPKAMIASYLGISPETLSRIRSNATNP